VRYWGAYVNQLAASKQRPAYAVATELYTEPHPKHQFHLHFNYLFSVKDEMIPAIREKIVQVDSLLMAPYAVNQNTEAPAGTPANKKF
jgi:hypothetical protein